MILNRSMTGIGCIQAVAPLGIALVFMSEWIEGITGLHLPPGIRHISVLALFGVIWTLYGRSIRIRKTFAIGLVLMAGFLCISLVLADVRLTNYILGTLLTFLFVVVFLLASSTPTEINTIMKVLNGMILFFVLTAMGPILTGLLSGTPLRDHPGVFRESGAFGAAMNMGIVLCLAVFISSRKRFYLILAGFLTFGIALTTLKKSLIENLLIWLTFLLLQTTTRLRVKLIPVILLLMCAGLYVVGPALVQDIDQNKIYIEAAGATEHVRIAMYLAAYRIASDYFPLGCGMGTFGNAASMVGGYSDIYLQYGVATIGYNSPEDVNRGETTIFDTYWPHILAELGFIGMSIFIFLWFYPMNRSYAIMRASSNPAVRGLSFFVVMTLFVVALEGFALSTKKLKPLTAGLLLARIIA
jgi:hypothetical protein